MPAALMGNLGLRNRELLINTLAYALLILAIIIIFLPLAWMLTVSVRPNLEVMKMPPDWIPQVFTLEGYAKIFSNDWQLAQRISNRVEEFPARHFDPLTALSRLITTGNLPASRKAAKVIQPNDIHVRQQRPQPVDTPAITDAPKRLPVINRIAP